MGKVVRADPEVLSRVAPRMSLLRVRCVAQSFSVHDEAAALSSEVPPRLSEEVGCEVRDQQVEFRIRFSARFDGARAPQASDEVTQPTKAAEISATFLLTYEHDGEGSRPSEADFQQFGDTNGLYNAWPYWREALQSACARAGLPFFMVPVLRVVIQERRRKPRTEPDAQGIAGSSPKPIT